MALDRAGAVDFGCGLGLLTEQQAPRVAMVGQLPKTNADERGGEELATIADRSGLYSADC